MGLEYSLTNSTAIASEVQIFLCDMTIEFKEMGEVIKNGTLEKINSSY